MSMKSKVNQVVEFCHCNEENKADIVIHVLGLTFVLLMNRTPQWKI